MADIKLSKYLLKLNNIADGLITLAKLNTTGASSGDVITYNGSNTVWDAPAGGGGSLIPLTTTIANCENTTSEITIVNATVPSNILAVGDIVNINLLYNLLQNSGSTVGRSTRFKIDNVTLISTLGNNRVSSVTESTYMIDIKFYVTAKTGNTVTLRSNNFTNATTLTRNATIMPSNANSTDGAFISSSNPLNTTFNDSTNKILAITYQWENANSNIYLRMLQANIHIIKGS